MESRSNNIVLFSFMPKCIVRAFYIKLSSIKLFHTEFGLFLVTYNFISSL